MESQFQSFAGQFILNAMTAKATSFQRLIKQSETDNECMNTAVQGLY